MSETVTLYPMDIRFSQNNISSEFSKALDKQKIGVVLDKIYNGDVDLLRNKILATMKVGRAPEQKLQQLWFTVNNRSLWVLKQLHLLGKRNDPITVEIDPAGIDKKRFSTKNEGKMVVIRNPPVGGTHAKEAPFWSFKLMAGAGSYLDTLDYDDGYDSDEYYELSSDCYSSPRPSVKMGVVY